MKVVKTSDIKAQESTSKIFRGKVSIQHLIGESEDELRAAVVNFSPDCAKLIVNSAFLRRLALHQKVESLCIKSQ